MMTMEPAANLNEYSRLQALWAAVGQQNAAHANARANAGLDEASYYKRQDRNELLVVSRAQVADGWKGYRCNNPECLAIFFSNEPIDECRSCHSHELAYRVVAGTYTSAPCDASCTNATGFECQCSCGGANHGSKWAAGFMFPRNAEARREAYRAARAITQEFKGDDYKALIDQAVAIEATLSDVLADALEAVDEKASELAQVALAIPAPVVMTKSKKPAADQPYDVLVTKVRTSEREAFNGFGRMERVIEITGAKVDGTRVWARLVGYDAPVRYVKCDCRHSFGDLSCWDADVNVGDIARITGRVKDHGDGITFVSHAKFVAAIDTYDIAIDTLPRFAAAAE